MVTKILPLKYLSATIEYLPKLKIDFLSDVNSRISFFLELIKYISAYIDHPFFSMLLFVRKMIRFFI